MTGDALSLALFADRIGLNVAALLAIGFSLHAALGLVARDEFRRMRWLGLAAAAGVIVFTALRLLILNAQLGDGTVLFDPELLSLSWTALGSSTMALVVGAIFGAAGLLLGSRILAGIGAVAVSIAFGLTGHTQGLAEPGLAPIMVASHVFIAGFWVAAPITLYPAASLGDDVLVRRLKRFSTIALGAIPLLICLGVWLAWVLAGGFEPLVGSTYGQLLLLKLAVGLAAMGLGALNRWIVTARLEAEPVKGRRWLRLMLTLETILFAAAVLAVSAATAIAGPSE